MPVHDITDNRIEKLVNDINRILARGRRLDLLWAISFSPALTPSFQQAGKGEGAATAYRQHQQPRDPGTTGRGYQRLELVAEAAESQTYPKRTETQRMAAETAQNARTDAELVDQTDEGEALVKNLARLIEEKRIKGRFI
jgi:hypothetical protein